MIITELYKGQGLGNQIWCYVTTRVLALDKGFDFGIKSPENFKALDFMDLDFGKQVFGGNGPEGGPPKTLPDGIKYYYNENRITHPNGSDIRNIDKNLITDLKDNTKIDGLLQGEKYIEHQKKEIREWLKVREEFEFYDFSDDNICIINFRGGGYVKDKDFFLRDDYWKDAVNNMLKINPDFKFIVITDDVKTAKKFFPKFEVYHFDIAKDYVVIKNARYLIMSNSSFAWFPTWLNENLKYCIAPKYWGRHNFSDGYWSLESNITKGWNYQDRDGNLQDYDSCIKELEEYKQKNKDIFLEECNFDLKEIYHPKNLKTTDKKYIMSLKKISRGLIYRSKLFIKRSISFALGSLLPSSFTERASFKENFQFVKTEKEARKKWMSENEIKEYRKKIKIYDVFTFFNELDLLEIRLNILDPYVDYFVIVEATETFSGHPKPLHYQENKSRFKKWENKIIHYVIDDTPKDVDDLRSRLHSINKVLSGAERRKIIYSLTSSVVESNEVTWLKEYYQKESINDCLNKLNLSDNDICYVSDLDEIWNPELLIDYSKDDIFKPLQTGYLYYLNNRTNQDSLTSWTGTILTKYKNIKGSCLNDLRIFRKMKSRYVFLENGGWHFAFQGGYEGAKKKLEEYKHFWYKPQDTLLHLKDRIENNKDYWGRNIRIWKDEKNLPKYILNNKNKYKKLLK